MDLLERVMADDQFRERFSLAEQLGVGGMGEVYKGVHKSLNRPVAIKFLATDLLREPLYRERFTAEAQLASQLIHSNVVAVFDFGIAAGVPYLVTEFVKGQTLSSVMRSKSEMDPETTIELACQLLDGLAAIHRIGIIHRDIKPDNLMVIDGPPRVLKIADFGIAKGQTGSGGPQTAAGLMLGTPAYMSPEQVLGDQIKPASDLYACGIIIYNMIIGQHPFQGDDAFDVVRRQLHEDPVIPKDLYKAVQVFLQKSLAKRSVERFETADEMKKSMQQFAEMVIAGGTWRREHATLPPQIGAPPAPDAAKWQLGESGVRKANEMGVTRIRAQMKAQQAAAGALMPVPGGLAVPGVESKTPTEVGLQSGSGVRPRMRPVAADRPVPPKSAGGLTRALLFALVCAGGVGVYLQNPNLLRNLFPKPVVSTAIETPPSVAAPVFSLRWANPVKTLLAARNPEAAAVIFRHAEREPGLSDMRFVDPTVGEVDQLLIDALDLLPRELDEKAVGVDKGPARRLCELAADFKPPLSPDTAKRFLATLEALETEARGRPERLPAGNVLQRLASAFRLVGASSNSEVTRELQHLLIAARSSPMVPLSGWSARLADAVLGPLTPAGTSLADLASRKSLAAAETKERPRLQAVLEWLEDELRATGNRVAAAPNQRCAVRKRWLINEIMLRADIQARKRSHADIWAVPQSFPVERFHEIEGYPSDMLSRLDATLTREGSLSADSAQALDVGLLCDLARTLGCPPNLIKRVEEDEIGCL